MGRVVDVKILGGCKESSGSSGLELAPRPGSSDRCLCVCTCTCVQVRTVPGGGGLPWGSLNAYALTAPPPRPPLIMEQFSRAR